MFYFLTKCIFSVPYADVSTKSIDCIILLSVELKSMLLISLAKKLCLSLLNLYRDFNINMLFIMKCFDFL